MVSSIENNVEILSDERKKLGIPRSTGFIYVLYNPLSNLVKIGTSLNPMRRTRNIACTAGVSYKQCRVWISPRVGDPYDIEESLHKHFSNYRKIGEWFTVDFSTAVKQAKSVCVPVSDETVSLMEKIAEKEGEQFMEGFKQLMSDFTDAEKELEIRKKLDAAAFKKAAFEYVRHLCNDVLKLENNTTVEVMDRTFTDLYGEDEKTKISPLEIAGHHTSLKGKPIDFSVHCHISNMWFSCADAPLPTPWADGLCFLLNCWGIAGYAPILVPIWSYVDEETNSSGWYLDEDFHCSLVENGSVDYFIRNADAWMWVTNVK